MMVLTDEEAAAIKKKLLDQLSNFPDDKQLQIKETVESLSTPQVEEFVEENALGHLGGNCIFCSIVAGKNPSFKIAESDHDVAILEINPLSKGHSLVVPKHHTSVVDDATKGFAQKVAQLLARKVSPQRVEVNELKVMDHALLEVVPMFGDEKDRRQATGEELSSLQQEILRVDEPPVQEPVQEAFPEDHKVPIFKLPPRIP